MLRFGWSRLSGNAGVAILALLGGLFLSPRIAEAACGDYLLIGGGHAPMSHSMPDQPTDKSSSEHSVPHQPCHGPGCNGGSVPPQAPVPVPTESIERWALTPGYTLPNPASSSNLLEEPPHTVTDGFRLGIHRPPR
jgi:hypothetical protein